MQFKTIFVAAAGAAIAQAQTDPGYSAAYTALQSAFQSVQTELGGLEAAAQTSISNPADLVAAYSTYEASANSALVSLQSSFDSAWGPASVTPTITGAATTITGASETGATATGSSGSTGTGSTSSGATTTRSGTSSSTGTATGSGTAASSSSTGGAGSVVAPAFAGLVAFLAAL